MLDAWLPKVDEFAVNEATLSVASGAWTEGVENLAIVGITYVVLLGVWAAEVKSLVISFGETELVV